ncbi:MAG: condensation domain-containing protein, partial [Bryobacteraceae bacterium]
MENRLETLRSLPSISVAGRYEPAPMSFGQERLWFLAQLEGVTQAYNVPLGFRLTGAVNEDALRRALDRLVARHEALRTTFLSADGEPVQRVAPEAMGFELRKHDLRQDPDGEVALRRMTIEEAECPFDLEAGPPIRGRLIRMADSEHVLLITLHHIASDGWSIGVLTRELSMLYGAFREDRADPLPALAIQYRDFAIWQRRWLSGERLQAQSDYWTGVLADAPALLDLPTDRPRPAQQDYTGAFVALELDERLTAKLKTLSLQHGASLFMTLLAGWGALLARLSRQDEVVIGAPVANRDRIEVEPLIGLFVTSLALRLDLSGGPTVGGLVERVKARVLEAQQHQDLPFEQVVEVLRSPRSLAHQPVFQALFAWQNNDEAKLDLPDLTVAPFETPCRFAKFDLMLDLAESEGRIVGGLEYATALFDKETVERHAGYLRRLLEAMAADDARTVDRLPLLSQAERQQLLYEWNATEADYPQDKCMHELFEAQAASTPEAVAVVYEEQDLSYAELNRRANQLAHYLRELGVRPDDRVAICVKRSFEMVVGLLAVLKAGGAYVPLDPAYPIERLTFILEDTAPKAALTHGPSREALDGALAGVAEKPLIVDLAAEAPLWAGQPTGNPDPASVGLTSQHLAYV